ncbi:MAG: hypothetical protein KGI54_18210 [Pseudomonadota bacterium]|nr:hypothetical protein [Pseudomonadota bacterium]
MGLSAIWELIKAIGPWLALGLLCVMIYLAGEHTIQRQFDAYKIEQRDKTEQALNDANKRVEDAKKTAEISAQIIGKTYDENTKANQALASTTDALLAARMQRDKAASRGCSLPGSPTSTSNDNATNTGTWELSERDAKVIDGRFTQANQLVEQLRAAQAYIKSLPEVCGGK